MPAFSYNIRSFMEQNIYALGRRRKAVARFTMSHEEYIQTFVPAEVRDMFRNIAPYNGGEDYASTNIGLGQFTDNSLMGRIHIRNDVKPAPPLVKGLDVQPDAPADVVARIKTWLENGGDVSRDFARVSRLLSVLNDEYSRAALRHHWPTIMALCDGHELTKDLVSELQVLRPKISPKPLPPGLVAACRKTAETISMARLIPEDVKAPEYGEVSIEVGPGQAYKEDGLGTFYGISL